MGGIIRLDGVVKAASDGRRLLDGVNLEVCAREHVLIECASGGSGAALMRIVAGMDRPDFGTAEVCGTSLHLINADETAALRLRNIGVCLRSPALFPNLPVWENAALPLTIRGEPKQARRERAMALLGRLGIGYSAEALPARLSQYEMRLAALARVLIASPQVLLLEDPAADLSERQAADFESLLAAQGEFTEAAALILISMRTALPADRRMTLEYGLLTEVQI